jgi:hypothetical protein
MILPAINPLVADTGSPPIPEAQGWTRRYDGARGPLIDLSQAVPGTPPHPGLLERMAATAGAAAGAKYGPIAGDADLRQTYAAEMARIYDGRIDPADVAVTGGCNMAFFAAMILLARAGDAVLLPTPWYFNHQMTLDMLGVEPRALPCRAEAGFVPDPRDAEALIDERVRALVLVTPNNPTGAVYPAHVIEAFADLCRRRGLWLVIDETYRDFLPAGVNRAHGLLSGEAWRSHVIQLYSFSKSFGIPGHRTGAVRGRCGGDRADRQDPGLPADLCPAHRAGRPAVGDRRPARLAGGQPRRHQRSRRPVPGGPGRGAGVAHRIGGCLFRLSAPPLPGAIRASCRGASCGRARRALPARLLFRPRPGWSICGSPSRMWARTCSTG